MTTRTSLLSSLFVLLVTSAASLAVAELGVRMLGLAPQIGAIEIGTRQAGYVASDDPVLRYTPRPGAPGINAFGIRDYEYAIEKGADTYRIVVLGDSIGFGYCTWNESLSLDSVFPNVLERDLRGEYSQYERVEVINLSVSGYNTLQEVAFFREKGLQLDPDLVLIAYCMNDDVSVGQSGTVELSREDERLAAPRALARQLRRFLLLRSHLARAVWYQLGRIGDAQKLESFALSEDGDYPARVSAGLGELAKLGDAHSFATLVVLFPHLHYQKDGVYSEGERHRVVADVAGEQGFYALDLLPGFLEASNGDLPAISGRCHAMHPDEDGHRLTAGLIQEFLRSHSLLSVPNAGG